MPTPDCIFTLMFTSHDPSELTNPMFSSHNTLWALFFPPLLIVPFAPPAGSPHDGRDRQRVCGDQTDRQNWIRGQ